MTDRIPFLQLGRTGLPVPRLTLGMWNNFGPKDDRELGRRIVLRAVELGMIHLDGGYNDRFLGDLLERDLAGMRDHLILTSKVGYGAYPYNGTSRKTVLAKIDVALRAMRVDSLDIFYLHRYDDTVPLEESMRALSDVVRWGKAIYPGISNFPPEAARRAARIMQDLGTPLAVHQLKYSMLTPNRLEGATQQVMEEFGIGVVLTSPLEQGILTDKYLEGIPEDSRAAKTYSSFKRDRLTPERLDAVRTLNGIAQREGRSLADLALCWAMSNPVVTSPIIGASRPEQIEANVRTASAFEPLRPELIDELNRVCRPVLLD